MNARLQCRLIGAGLLPLSLRRVRMGQRYTDRPPTPEDRMRAYRAATPLPEIAHAWPLNKSTGEK